MLSLDFERRFWPAALNLGILEDLEGDREGAIKQFERVVRLNSPRSADSEANFRLATTYVAMGHRQKALEYFEASVEVDPEGDWAAQARDYINDLEELAGNVGS